jgi:DNA polymerase
MSHFQNGIIDYLEIMQFAGVCDVPLPKKKPEGNANAAPSKELPKPEPIVENMPREKHETKATLPKQEQLDKLAKDVAKCTLCPNLLGRTQTVFGTGNPDAELVFIGEAPGADEDKQGIPFVGRAGQLLTDIITKGMNLRREDVYICNILRCRPPENRNPEPTEAANCRPFLDATLEIVQPKFICCLGAVAAKNLLQTERTIGSLRGRVFDYNGIKVLCTYHPAYLLRNPAAKAETWKDIQILMKEMGLSVPAKK